jgi:hypothetical protein
MKAQVRIKREQLEKASDEQQEYLWQYPNTAPGRWRVTLLTSLDTGDMLVFIEGDTEPVQDWLKVIMPIAEL